MRTGSVTPPPIEDWVVVRQTGRRAWGIEGYEIVDMSGPF